MMEPFHFNIRLHPLTPYASDFSHRLNIPTLQRSARRRRKTKHHAHSRQDLPPPPPAPFTPPTSAILEKQQNRSQRVMRAA